MRRATPNAAGRGDGGRPATTRGGNVVNPGADGVAGDGRPQPSGRSVATPGPDPAVVLEGSGLAKHFRIAGALSRDRHKVVRAVDGVDLAIRRGTTLGLVGESGCGKSTVGRLLLRLLEPSAGTIRLGGEDITAARGRELRTLRARMQIVFQDPFASLNGRWRVGDILAAPFRIHRSVEKEPCRRGCRSCSAGSG